MLLANYGRYSNTWTNARLTTELSSRQVLPEDAMVGSIVWLRQKYFGDEKITRVRPGHCGSYEIFEQGYQHPVVILKICQRENSTIPGDFYCAVTDVSTVKLFIFSHFVFQSKVADNWTR